MKATIEIDDELYRRVKAKAALEGRTIRDVTGTLYQNWLEGEADSAEKVVSVYEQLKEYGGKYRSGVNDLSTNPKYLEGFGCD